MKVKFSPGKDPAAYTGQEYEGQEVTLTQLRRRAGELLGEPYEEPPMPQTPEEMERHIMAHARMIADNAARDHKTAEAHQLQIAAMLAEELREQRARGTVGALPARDPYEGLDREGAAKPFPEHLKPYLDTIGRRSESTISGYQKTFERLEALIGAKATADIDTLDVERFYRSLVDTKTDKGAVVDLRDQRSDLVSPRADDHPEFGQMGAQRIDEHGPLPDQQLAGPMQHQHRLLVDGLDRNQPHVRARHRLGDGRRVRRVVLLAALDVRFHLRRWQQAHLMAETGNQPRPMMRGRACLHPHNTRRQLAEELADLGTAQLTA